MNIGIVGLGLIGGSLAKAYKASGHRVFAMDMNKSVTEYAKMQGVLDGKLDDSAISECDYVFVALYPQAAAEYIETKADLFKKNSVVIDCCGTKRLVCERCFPLAKEKGFHFIGGHPMAGTQFSGYKYSKPDMFSGATMILVPPPNSDINLLNAVKAILMDAHFASVTLTNAEEHDKRMAFTSQLAHAVSNAYVKSPSAQGHHSFSAGSYRDLTRVAKLNEQMWTELFIENGEHLTAELDTLINSLTEYRDAIASGDSQRLCELLKEGRLRKEEIDTEWKEKE